MGAPCVPAHFPVCWRSPWWPSRCSAVRPVAGHRVRSRLAAESRRTHRSGPRHLQPGSRHLHGAGEPVLRSLLRHVPGSRRHPASASASRIRSAKVVARARITTPNIFDAGGPHNERASRITINNGQMDGAVRALRAIGNACKVNPARPGCEQAVPGPNGAPDVMGYHTADEIPELLDVRAWFTLQDRMFAPSDSWTCPLICTWCRDGPRRVTTSTRCSVAPIRSSPDSTPPTTGGSGCRADGKPRPYVWADITWLLAQPRRELGAITSARTVASGRRAASRPRRARTRS